MTEHATSESVTCALFGLPLDKPPLAGKTVQEVAEFLSQGGVNAVVHVPLDSELIAALHAEGIRCYGEIGFFAGSEDLWKESPESRPVLADGKLLAKAGWYVGLTPTHEERVKKVLAKIKKECSEYELDGYWLDFIRWPTRWEMKEPLLFKTDYSGKTLERFQRETGVTLPATAASIPEKASWIDVNAQKEWTAWRCGVIRDVVRRVRETVHELRGPDALIGIFYVPLLREEYDGAIVNIVGQDARLLSDVVDVFSPMSYHAMCVRDTKWITQVSADIRKVTEKPIWPIIQAASEPRAIPADEFRETLKAGLSGGSSGVMAFTAKDVLGTPLWEVQSEVFRQERRLREAPSPTAGNPE